MTHSATTGVFSREVDAFDCAIELGFAGGRVISLSFPETVAADTTESHALLDRIEAYAHGEQDSFDDVAIGLTVPTDHRDVLESLRTIPYGADVSVSRLTRMAGLDANDPDDLDIVTGALTANPIPLLVPDHRVSGGPYATPTHVRERLRQIETI